MVTCVSLHSALSSWFWPVAVTIAHICQLFAFSGSPYPLGFAFANAFCCSFKPTGCMRWWTWSTKGPGHTGRGLVAPLGTVLLSVLSCGCSSVISTTQPLSIILMVTAAFKKVLSLKKFRGPSRDFKNFFLFAYHIPSRSQQCAVHSWHKLQYQSFSIYVEKKGDDSKSEIYQSFGKHWASFSLHTSASFSPRNSSRTQTAELWPGQSQKLETNLPEVWSFTIAITRAFLGGNPR